MLKFVSMTCLSRTLLFCSSPEGAALSENNFINTQHFAHRILTKGKCYQDPDVLIRFVDKDANILTDDFVFLSTTTATSSSYLQVCKNEAAHILNGVASPRAGSANGFFFPDRKSTQLSTCTQEDSVIVPMKRRPGAKVVYRNGSIKCFSGVYPIANMRRLNTRERTEQILESSELQDVIVAEMTARIRSICVASQCVNEKYLETLDFWRQILQKAMILNPRQAKTEMTLDKLESEDKISTLLKMYLQRGRSVLASSFLVLASTTGAMNNHFATTVHKDGNTSHPVETLGYYARVPEDAMEILDPAFAYLFFPDARLTVSVTPCSHIINCSLTNIRHVADFSRNMTNWCCAYGPR